MSKKDFWEGYVPEPVNPSQQAIDKMAENARELGLDYEPLTGTQISKVWWDGEKLMAKPIPFVEFYKPAQQEPVAWIDMSQWPPIRWRDGMIRKDVDQFDGQGLYTSPPAQRTWVGLTDKDWNRSKHNYDFQKGVDWAESILKEKNA